MECNTATAPPLTTAHRFVRYLLRQDFAANGDGSEYFDRHHFADPGTLKLFAGITGLDADEVRCCLRDLIDSGDLAPARIPHSGEVVLVNVMNGALRGWRLDVDEVMAPFTNDDRDAIDYEEWGLA